MKKKYQKRLSKEGQAIKRAISALFIEQNVQKRKEEEFLLRARITSSEPAEVQYLINLLDMQIEQIYAEKVMGYTAHGRNQTPKEAVERIKEGKA